MLKNPQKSANITKHWEELSKNRYSRIGTLNQRQKLPNSIGNWQKHSKSQKMSLCNKKLVITSRKCPKTHSYSYNY